MGAMTSAPGVISAPNRYYCGAAEVMEYLGCKENKAYDLINSLDIRKVKTARTE